ncbi:hypothetical protein LY76DRAFT_73783 [Colletotrichum caudatum]|nr:hypothetical protein LY76DRAFT_73783 [Colletotrichum caudatum]
MRALIVCRWGNCQVKKSRSQEVDARQGKAGRGSVTQPPGTWKRTNERHDPTHIAPPPHSRLLS